MNDKGLGKGLDALLPEAEARDEELRRIPVDEIEPDPNQPRKHFDEEKLNELTQSIQQQGLVEPVVVRPRDGSFLLVAGERRWRASCQAGLERIPALVRDLDASDALAISVIENIQRENLTAVEEARAYERLLEEQDWSQQELADNVGRSRSAVANQVRLLKLPEEILEGLDKSEVSSGHARALLSLDSDEEMLEAYHRIIERSLNVRQTEKLIQAWPPDSGQSDTGTDDGEESSTDFSRLESQLEDAVGAPISIESKNRKKGHIKIFFNDPDEFELIQQRLAGEGGD